MKIKKETLELDAVYYTTEIEYDNKIFYASLYYWINQETSDWNIYSDDCDFDELPIETQNKLMSFAFDTWADSNILSGVDEILNTIKH